MFAPAAPARLIAIFDWELATIGDPLAGTTDDEFFDRLGAGVPAMAERAWRTATGGGPGRTRAG